MPRMGLGASSFIPITLYPEGSMRRAPLFTLFLLALYGTGCSDTENPVSPDLGVPLSSRGTHRDNGQGQPGQHNGSNLVPFKAHYDEQVTLFAPEPGCDAAGEGRLFLHGEGTGTHVGRSTIELSFCGRGATLDSGRGTFVAANGDLLYITFYGVSDQGFPVLYFTSYVTFAGGTGRFAGATGTATVDGSFNLLTGSGPADWIGMISFPQTGEMDEG